MTMIKKLQLTLLLSLLVGFTMAGEGPQQKGEEEAKPAAKTATAGGMIYTTEQARGANGELPDELREALSNLVNTSSEGLTEKELDDGTVMVDLQGRFQSAMVVSIGENGELKSGCYSTVPGHACDSHQTQATSAKAETDKPKK